MLTHIVDSMRQLNSETPYKKVVNMNYKKITELYSFSTYKNNLKNFYLGNYNFIPAPRSAERLIGDIMREKGQLIEIVNQHTDSIQQDQKQINALRKAIGEQRSLIEEGLANVRSRDTIISRMSSSVSWRITKPLRVLAKILESR